MVTIERVGARVYFGGDTFAVKDRIKGLGGHWDKDRKQWWLGAAKLKDAEALASELTAPVMVATPASRALAESVGLEPDAPAGVVSDKLRDLGREADADTAAKAPEDLSKCRVFAKVEYKGRTYYAVAEQNDRATGQPLRCRLTTLDGDVVFWADCSECRLLKRYEGRQKWDGRRYSGRTVTVYPTIGSLREFRDDQQTAQKAGTPACAACGKRGALHHDLEDGLMKCYGCCDIPE